METKTPLRAVPKAFRQRLPFADGRSPSWRSRCMPRYTATSARLRRFRSALIQAESQGRPVDEVDDEREAHYEQWLARSLEQSAEREGERTELIERVLEHGNPEWSGVSRSDLLRLAAVGVGL